MQQIPGKKTLLALALSTMGAIQTDVLRRIGERFLFSY